MNFLSYQASRHLGLKGAALGLLLVLVSGGFTFGLERVPLQSEVAILGNEVEHFAGNGGRTNGVDVVALPPKRG